MKPNVKFENIIGFRSGKLIVLKNIENIKGKKYVLCQCDCGAIKEIYKYHITNGQTKSCGCISRRPDRNALKLYNKHKNDVKLRRYESTLTLEEYSSLCFSNCFYCDNTPTNRYKPSPDCKPDWIQRGTIVFNGIDRINSDLNYNKENCVACCKYCNIMKNKYSKEFFFKQLELIYNKHIKDKKMNEPLDYTRFNATLAKELSYAEHDIALLKIENQSLKETIVELQKELDNTKS